MNTGHFATRAGLIGATALFTAAGFAGQAYASSPASSVTTPAAGSASATPADPTGAGIDTGTLPGTTTLCESDWAWHVHPGAGGYSEVEWTSNPCGFAIQDRSLCEDPDGSTEWSTSGVVVRTGLEDRASCSPSETIIEAQVRFRSGTTWTAWLTYWPS